MTGRLVSGSGTASFFTSLEWVKDKCQGEFGFVPYPGTLNIKVSPKEKSVLQSLRRRSEVIFWPPPGSGFYPARATRVQVNGIESVAVFPASEVNIHNSDIIEVMSAVCLRDVLGVKEGDEVEISLSWV